VRGFYLELITEARGLSGASLVLIRKLNVLDFTCMHTNMRTGHPPTAAFKPPLLAREAPFP
jgi:hypothetical protein